MLTEGTDGWARRLEPVQFGEVTPTSHCLQKACRVGMEPQIHRGTSLKNMVSVWKEQGKIIRRKNRRDGETSAGTIIQPLTLKVYLKQISALSQRRFRCRLSPSEGSHCGGCGFI